MPASWATSSRRNPGVRRRGPRESPTSSGCRASRRRRRNSASCARSMLPSCRRPRPSARDRRSPDPPALDSPAAPAHPGRMNASRITLITGGSRGLGRAAALALAEAGSDILLTYRTEADAAAAVVADVASRGRRAVALQLDTADPDGFADFAARLRDTLQATWQRDTFDALV